MRRQQAVSIPRQTLSRLPYYLGCIVKAKEEGREFISAPVIAAELNLHEVQVRKDLAAISKISGIPKKGFRVNELLCDIEQVMGDGTAHDAVLIGAGSLGHALLSYDGFGTYGLQIVAAFDLSETRIGQEIGGKRVFAMSQLSDICRRLRIRIGIITVPAAGAQEVCDELVECGILAIWNFTSIHLSAPEHILIQDVNMAASLLMLSQHLQQRLDAQDEAEQGAEDLRRR